MNDKKFAVIYARQSSGKEEDSESIELQIEECKKLAASKKLIVVSILTDANTSGRLYPSGSDDMFEQDEIMKSWLEEHSYEKKSRPGLGEVMSYLPEVHYVIFYDLTRLYRPLQGSFLQNFVDMKFRMTRTKMLSVKEGEIDPGDSSERLIRSIKSDINDNQLKITSEKSKKAMRKLRDDGICPTNPKMYGIKYLGGKDKVVEVDPEAAKVIRYTIESILALKPYNAIIREVNQQFPNHFKGKGFYNTSLRHIAAQPFYCGYMYDSNGNLIKAKQMQGKAIITLEQWEEVQKIMNCKRTNNVRRKDRIHPFSKLLECGHCKSKMIIGIDNDKVFYHCYHGGNDCDCKECRQSRVIINLKRHSNAYTGLREAIAPILVLALYEQLQKINGSAGEQKKLRALNQELERLAMKQGQLEFEAMDDSKEFNFARNVAERCQEKINAIKREIFRIKQDISTREDTIERINEYFSKIDELINNQVSDEQYFKLLHDTVKKIRCYHDRIEIVTNYGEFTLMRYMIHQFRNFPRFDYEFTWDDKNSSRDMKDSKMVLTYKYTGADTPVETKLIVNFGVMKIYSYDERTDDEKKI